MFDIIQFLAKQNLALRGHREDDTGTNRGNFLELVHLLAKYDPVLGEHLVRIKMGQNISLSYYVTSNSQRVHRNFRKTYIRQVIIARVQKAKYYSMIFDSTPDISHKDQTSQVLRYVMIENQEVRVEESFIDYIETKSKIPEGITDMIVSKHNADGLDVMNCRGQAYDNAATMAGCHTGVQQRIKDINPNAEFVPCPNHSLNLVCRLPTCSFSGSKFSDFLWYARTLLRFFLRRRTGGKFFLQPQETV